MKNVQTKPFLALAFAFTIGCGGTDAAPPAETGASGAGGGGVAGAAGSPKGGGSGQVGSAGGSSGGAGASGGGASGSAGSAGTAGGAGSAGSATSPPCTAEEVRCTPIGELQKCNDAGGWQTLMMCPDSTCNASQGDCSAPPMCSPGSADCNGAAGDGCEANVGTDPMQCGACGRTCSADHVDTAACESGVCKPTCEAGFADCSTPSSQNVDNGCETSLLTDSKNCGACGVDCLGASCKQGICNTQTLFGSIDAAGALYADADAIYVGTRNYIYRRTLDNQNMPVLANHPDSLISGIVSHDGWVYYAGVLAGTQTSGLRRVRKSDLKVEDLSLGADPGVVHTLLVRGKYLLIAGTLGVFSMDLDTLGSSKIVAEGTCGAAEQNQEIYFKTCDSMSGTLKKRKADGSIETLATGVTPGLGGLAIGKLSVFVGGKSSSLDRISLNDGSRTEVMKQTSSSGNTLWVTVANDTVYFAGREVRQVATNSVLHELISKVDPYNAYVTGMYLKGNQLHYAFSHLDYQKPTQGAAYRKVMSFAP